MKQYYLERLHWIFNYTSKNFFYCIAKTLCLIVGIPIYAVMFALEMVLTAVNMIFSWIPILNLFIMVVCKSIIFVTDKTFYICILPDIRKYLGATKAEVDYEVMDEAGLNGETATEQTFQSEAVETEQDNAKKVDCDKN